MRNPDMMNFESRESIKDATPIPKRRRSSGKKKSEIRKHGIFYLLEGLKMVNNNCDNHLDKNKVLTQLVEDKDPYAVEGSMRVESASTVTKKKKMKRFNHKIKVIEHLIKNCKSNQDFQNKQLQVMLQCAITIQMDANLDEGINVFRDRCALCIIDILDLLMIGDQLPSFTIRQIFRTIQEKHYWKMEEECFNLVQNLCIRSKDEVNCLLFTLEIMQTNNEHLAESANILLTILSCYKPHSISKGVIQLLEGCCQLLAECDPNRSSVKYYLERCIVTLVLVSEIQIVPLIAQHTVRVSIGPYRSDIADLLYNICIDRDVSGLIDLINPLILMLDDRDADVVIRGYQIFTQVLSPSIACLYRMHSTDNLLSQAGKISNENQMVCPTETLTQIKNVIKQIILTLLICYIRHAIYPKTLEAILTFNCTLIIEIKDPFLLPSITSFLLNLQEAALSILPTKSMRQSFIQWAVLHLFLLVTDVYSISSLKEYVHEVIQQRKTLAPFLLSPIQPSPMDSIHQTCLMGKQQVKTIIENWNELVEPTRTLHKAPQPSKLSILSAWDDLDFEL